jgi:hypothetical protein
VRRRALVAAVLLAACASGPRTDPVAEARQRDVEALAAPETETPDDPRHWIVVQDGAVAAVASFVDDAVRAAQEKAPDPVHRFVFRPADRGDRMYRMTYLPDGGIVVGRRFLEDLGLETTTAAGRATGVRRRDGGTPIDLTRTPRIAVDVTSLDGADSVSLTAAYDPDFEGGLLVPRSTAAALHLERAETPGRTDVLVAIARPFSAIRATAFVHVPDLQVSGPAEVLFETAPRR